MGVWGRDAPRKTMSESYWHAPVIWDREAAKRGVPVRVFAGSMCDVFEQRPDLESRRDRLFELISATPNLTWMLLTKRPAAALATLRDVGWCLAAGEVGVPDRWEGPPNVWIGTTAENQGMAAVRLPHLRQTGAPVRFVSAEPLLGPVHLGLAADAGVDWVIVGGESGRRARPIEAWWVRSIVVECAHAQVPVFFKQWGASMPGARLDGRLIEEFPTP